jgi:hypothetical protein
MGSFKCTHTYMRSSFRWPGGAHLPNFLPPMYKTHAELTFHDFAQYARYKVASIFVFLASSMFFTVHAGSIQFNFTIFHKNNLNYIHSTFIERWCSRGKAFPLDKVP